jgi:hypothetical protein
MECWRLTYRNSSLFHLSVNRCLYLLCMPLIGCRLSQQHHAPDPAKGYWLNQALPRAGEDGRWQDSKQHEEKLRQGLEIPRSVRKY